MALKTARDGGDPAQQRACGEQQPSDGNRNPPWRYASVQHKVM
ncbi:MAG TPA: hypothetical protein VHW70_13740 [Edaphobacter sp.]|nr:hypothetical protein [Edaphobacter sp.]